MYEISLPYGLDLNNPIDVDKSATRMTVSTKTVSSNEVLALDERALQWLASNAPNIAIAHSSGTTLMFAFLGRRNIISMLVGTTVALVGISFCLIAALRSLRLGLTSLVPNLVPGALGLGIRGLAVAEVGVALSLVTTMTLGLVVDDTVHFLTEIATHDPGRPTMFGQSGFRQLLFEQLDLVAVRIRHVDGHAVCPRAQLLEDRNTGIADARGEAADIVNPERDVLHLPSVARTTLGETKSLMGDNERPGFVEALALANGESQHPHVKPFCSFDVAGLQQQMSKTGRAGHARARRSHPRPRGVERIARLPDCVTLPVLLERPKKRLGKLAALSFRLGQGRRK